jgi:carbon monoxide dehydrogenase subunit G
MNPPIDESVVIARAPSEVFAFVADFENLPRFCATSSAVKKESPGTIGLGTTFQQTFVMYGWSMKTPVELVAFEPGRSLTYQAHGGPRVEGVCQFEPDGAGTRLRYTLALRPRGLYRLFAPLLVRILRQQTRNDLVRLKALLEAKPAIVAA